jgi:hypothetical protein
MKRPRIITPCVADRHAMKGERIAEFSTDHGGGLIRVRQSFDGTEIEIYRCDPTVRIITPPDPARNAAPDMLEALRDIAKTPKQGEPEDGDPRYEQNWEDEMGRYAIKRLHTIIDTARAAIAKAEGRANG